MNGRVALLRGVNVGGNKVVPAATLRALGEALGFGSPQTVVNSGNLVFSSDRDPADLEAAIGAALIGRLNVRSDVYVRKADAWRELMDANPFPDAAARNPSQLTLIILREPPSADVLERLRAVAAQGERFEAQGAAIYFDFLHGMGTSKLAERSTKLVGTGRNWNTVSKIAALLSLPD